MRLNLRLDRIGTLAGCTQRISADAVDLIDLPGYIIRVRCCKSTGTLHQSTLRTLFEVPPRQSCSGEASP